MGEGTARIQLDLRLLREEDPDQPTIEQDAAAIGISKSRLSEIERGVGSVPFPQTIARILTRRRKLVTRELIEAAWPGIYAHHNDRYGGKP